MQFPAHRSAVLLAVLVAASPPGKTSVAAQQANARVDSLFSFATATTPGCAVGAIKDGQVLYARGYGLADIEHQGHTREREKILAWVRRVRNVFNPTSAAT